MPAATRSLQGLFNWREGLASSLPLVLMAVLGGLTWWLVRHTPQPDAPRVAKAPTHEVDYDMSGFTARRFGSDGAARAIVWGRTMRHYADDGSVEIDELRATGFDRLGRQVHATAQRGWSNAKQTELRLTGQARIQRDAASAAPAGPTRPLSQGRLSLQGEELWLYPEAQRVRSDRAVVIIGEHSRIESGALDHDGRTGITQMSRSVRGQHSAPPRP